MTGKNCNKPKLLEYEKEIIRGIGSKVQYKKGQVISSPGEVSEKIHLIESGSVITYRLAGDGRHVVEGDTKNSGDFLGIAEALCGVKRECYAGAIDDVVLISVIKEDFQDILACDPFLLKKVMNILACSINIERMGSC